MKATTTILAAVFTLSMNVLFAGNDGASMNSETSTVRLSLAPATPVEATFEEVNDATFAAFILAPVTPAEADFTDAIEETTINISALAPVTPAEADFASDDETACAGALAPVTPSVADFSDWN
ncbi:MAG: hypothetical protein WCK34_06375 [Bacteroidota bacterium]